MNNQAQLAIQHANAALKNGDRREARRWAEKGAALAPEREEPWLLLAALASPRASVAYLNKALAINPESQRARQGMHWAVKRYRSSNPAPPKRQLIPDNISIGSLTRTRTAAMPWILVLILVSIGLFLWFVTPTISFATSPLNIISFEPSDFNKASFTPSATLTSSPTLTFTASPTALPSSTPTVPPTLTATLEPTETQTPIPESNSVQSISLPSAVARGEHWIDIDLTNQRAYAYQGKNLINSFIISTGTWQHPTVTGQYSIYVKYLYADMAGPGYYLPNVPYVMYFYKGYGLHGTYWHNNFGTPMSHGCINFQTDDAGWVYNWVSIGTIVNIHY